MRARATYRADDINLRVSAQSLEGSFKADGSAQIAGVRQSLRIATRRRGANGIRVKAEIQLTDIAATLQTDGLLGQEDGKPIYDGGFTAQSVADVANGQGEGSAATLEPQVKLWRSEGSFSLNPGALEVDKASLRYGPEDRAVRIDGDGRVDFGATPSFTARLSGKQLDLDRFSGAGPSEPLSIKGGAEALIAVIKALPLPPIPGLFKLDLPALVVAGGLAQDIHLEAETLPRGWKIADLEARLPGQTTVSGRGELRSADEPAFSGQVRIDSPATFRLRLMVAT
ncbi:hypothetical protein [Breoghania sp.]|uniref:hypothetical protein n=1 Tax=Breoghania sp. TaxID=2065378 RepID=UPI00261F6F05|nr:hypothetical protein [Breoghania sp.]MDJ0931177.1 hypothetical protein [Breoghania sp.]